MMTLAGPLPPNMPFTLITPIAFTFSDGVQTITNLTPPGTAVFRVATGGSGQIMVWSLLVSGAGNIGVILTDGDLMARTGFDGGNINAPDNFGFNIDRPGTWTRVASVADTGS